MDDTTVSTDVADVSSEQTSMEDSNTIEDSQEETSTAGEQTGAEEVEAFSKINPDELPDELKGVYKQMQGDYTRKTQELSALKRDAEEFRRLQQEQLVKEKFPAPQATVSEGTQDMVAEAFGLDPATMDADQRAQLSTLAKGVEHIAKKMVAESITPMQNQLMAKEINQELSETRKKYSDFDQHIPAIQSLVKQNPSMTYEDAYKLATWEEQKKAGVSEAYANMEKKKEKASPTTKTQATEDKEYNNFFEAAKASMRELGLQK